MWDGDVNAYRKAYFQDKSSKPTVWDGDNSRKIFAVVVSVIWFRAHVWDGDMITAAPWNKGVKSGSKPTVWDGDSLSINTRGSSIKSLFQAHRVGW